jgi:predicted SAM-dependent methyltransferase
MTDGGAPRLLNVGCGSRFHRAWVNVDAAPGGREVRAHDVRRGLPFPDRTFDAVYHSHVLEHLDREHGLALLRECRRVLVPGGVIRVVVPDLEGIARSYLEALQDARRNLPGAGERHAWMMLEMLDQSARHESGGEVPGFLGAASHAGREFAVRRCGAEIRALLEARAAPRTPLGTRLRRTRGLVGIGARWLLGLIAGARFRVGAFRTSGEVHLCMYDAFSLEQALGAAGFVEVRVVGATESWIPRWTEYLLDADGAGTPHKPDSLYVEARVPLERPR